MTWAHIWRYKWLLLVPVILLCGYRLTLFIVEESSPPRRADEVRTFSCDNIADGTADVYVSVYNYACGTFPAKLRVTLDSTDIFCGRLPCRDGGHWGRRFKVVGVAKGKHCLGVQVERLGHDTRVNYPFTVEDSLFVKVCHYGRWRKTRQGRVVEIETSHFPFVID